MYRRFLQMWLHALRLLLIVLDATLGNDIFDLWHIFSGESDLEADRRWREKHGYQRKDS